MICTISDIKFVDQIPLQDIPVYFTNEYNAIMAQNDGAIAKIIEVSFEKNKQIYIPILLKEIEKNIYEAYTAYGYGGFLTQNTETIQLFKDEFYKFKAFMKDHQIIDLFIRNSPFLENEKLLEDRYNQLNRYTYLIELVKELDTLQDFINKVGSKLRWSIQYAIKHKIKIFFIKYDAIEFELSKFHEIYTHAMNEKNTNDYYFFSYEFFEQHFKRLKDKCELAVAINDEGEIIAGALFLLDDYEMAHYHFSALNKTYSKFQISELLLAEAIVRYTKMGKKYLHLGGGGNLDESDGLSRFKKQFSTRRYPYYISKIVFDQQKYDALRSHYNHSNSKLFLIKDL